jgi:hypothetical protein
VRLLLTTAMLGCLATGQAAAEPYRATSVDVRNAAALLIVIPEDRADVEATVAAGSRLPAPSMRLEGNHLVIDGGLRVQGCGGWFQSGPRSSVRVAGYGLVTPDHLQRITVHVPRTLNLSVGGGVHSTIGASQGGRVALNGCGHTEMSDAAGALDLVLNGSGDVRVGAVGAALQAALNGSGNINVARSGADSSLSLNGSGDVGVGDVAGGLDVRLVGSGDIRAGTTAGARLMLDGSGDIEVADVRGPLTARLAGSGGIRVRSAQAPRVDLALSSSGDIAVRGGHADQLIVNNTGSGDVRFDGTAAASRLTVSGSGDVSVEQAGQIEVLRDSGSGGIHVGK